MRTASLVPSREYAKNHHYDLSNITFKELPKDFNGYQMVMKWSQKQVSTAIVKSGVAYAKATLDRYSKEALQIRMKKDNLVMLNDGKSLRRAVPEGQTMPRGTNPDGSACGGSDFVPNQLWVCAVVPTGDDVAEQEHCDEIGHNVDNPDGSGEWVDQPPCEETPPPTDCELYGIGCGGEEPDPGDGDGCMCNEQPPTHLDSLFNEIDIQDSCLKSMVDSALRLGLTNKLSGLIQTIFGGTQQHTNITFDSHDFGYNGADGTTNLGNKTANALYFHVTLNSNIALTGSSEEYVAATIFHECLHAYIMNTRTDSTSNDESHELMATSANIDLVANAIRETCNNRISLQEARDLAWGCLYKSSAKTIDTQGFLNLSSSDQVRIKETNVDFKYGSSGKQCK